MLLWSLAVTSLCCLRYATSLEVLGSAIGVPEPVKVWSILQFLLPGEKGKILPDLYPYVTQLEESEAALECPDCDLVATVGEILTSEYELSDIAALLPLYADLYPMGLPQYVGNGSNENYFVLNGKRYDKSDDVFYLKSKELQEQARAANSGVVGSDEVVIGIEHAAPIVLLHGCPDDDGVFEEFNRNLYSEASSTGKLRYVWRSTCSHDRSAVKGIPLGLTKRDQSDPSVLPPEVLNIPAEFASEALSLYDPNNEELADLDLKVASLIAKHYQGSEDFHSTLEYAKGIINNFRLLAKQLTKLKTSTSKVLKSNEKLSLDGIDYNMLGLYINGQNWRLSEADNYNLINAITHEYFTIKHLESILQKYDDVGSPSNAKRLLQIFSEASLLTLQQSQPVKIDLHRIQGFSEAIIYFNDIEIDGQYEELATDVQNFFEESKFGELPDVRQNWNEVIFVIDFGNLEDENNKIALDGLNRAIKVIAQGYPQRVGLLPLNLGAGDGLIHKIYQLKHADLTDLAEFLEDIPARYIGTRYQGTPDHASVVEKLQIRETSIIINGEIYPFRKNTWHYLIAKTIKKDKSYLKGELAKIMASDPKSVKNMNVRDILHAKSANSRHEKYTPDYFSDASYTPLNNAALKAVGDSVIEKIKGDNYIVLHTITLVDDFSTSAALKRLKNILNTTFFGVRIRLINSGPLDKTRWRDIKRAVKRSDIEKLDSLIESYQANQPQFVSNHKALSNWLVDIPVEPITKGAFLVVNGRFIQLDSDEVPTKDQFEAIIKREAQRTLDTMRSLEQLFPDFAAGSMDPDFIETLSSTLSKLFYHGADIYNNGIDYTAEGTLPRMSLPLKHNGFTVFQSHDTPKPVDVTLFMDPLEERSQKLVSSLTLLEEIPFVNLQIVLLPTEDLKISPINRVYVEGTAPLEISKDVEGNFHVELDTPSNLLVSNTSELAGVIVEAHVFPAGEPSSRANIDGIGGVCLELVNRDQEVEATCITMGTFGYCQFIVRAEPTEYTVRSCDPRYRVTSFASNGRVDYIDSQSLTVRDLNKLKLRVEVEETGAAPLPQQDALNIYTVLKDNGQDEAKAEAMIQAILDKTPEDETVKIWILDQPFLTQSFKQFCRRTNRSSSRGSIEFITYAWPRWLRPQSVSDRRLDLFKILFVDVMFPQTTARIVYLEPEPTIPDPFEMVRQSSGDSPLAMFEATGRGFWQEGYWASKLAETQTRFHTARPGFVVDLQRLRKIHGGDTLRVHYQRLSADIHSLSHTHEDLINDLQLEIAIDSLSARAWRGAVRHDEL